jgi:hypothetical protein
VGFVGRVHLPVWSVASDPAPHYSRAISLQMEHGGTYVSIHKVRHLHELVPGFCHEHVQIRHAIKRAIPKRLGSSASLMSTHSIFYSDDCASLHVLMIRTRPSIPRIAWPSVRHKAQTRCVSAAAADAPARRRTKGALTHWQGDKLDTTEKYPLSVALSKVIHPSILPKETKGTRKVVRGKTVSSSGVHVRTQIVSPDLCGMSSPEGQTPCAPQC